MARGRPPEGAREIAPDDYGHRVNRCVRCGCWLCRYHDPDDDGGLCWPCAPGGGGVVLQVAAGEYRRFTLDELALESARRPPAVPPSAFDPRAAADEREHRELVELLEQP